MDLLWKARGTEKKLSVTGHSFFFLLALLRQHPGMGVWSSGWGAPGDTYILYLKAWLEAWLLIQLPAGVLSGRKWLMAQACVPATHRRYRFELPAPTFSVTQPWLHEGIWGGGRWMDHLSVSIVLSSDLYLPKKMKTQKTTQKKTQKTKHLFLKVI